MANSPQAKKRARQAITRTLRNVSQRSTMRTAIKKVQKAIKEGDKDAAKAAFETAIPLIDRAGGKGLIHENKAARIKSRLNDHLKAL